MEYSNSEKVEKRRFISWDSLTILDIIRHADMTRRLNNGLKIYCYWDKENNREKDLFKDIDFELVKRARNFGKRSLDELEKLYNNLNEEGGLKL